MEAGESGQALGIAHFIGGRAKTRGWSEIPVEAPPAAEVSCTDIAVKQRPTLLPVLLKWKSILELWVMAMSSPMPTYRRLVVEWRGLAMRIVFVMPTETAFLPAVPICIGIIPAGSCVTTISCLTPTLRIGVPSMPATVEWFCVFTHPAFSKCVAHV